MSKNKEIEEINPGAGQSAPPTLTNSLRDWLQEQMGDLSAAEKSQTIDFTAKEFSEILQIFLRAADLEDAGRVLQGYALCRMRAISETSTAAFLAKHGISNGTAYRSLADFGLFNSGLTLPQIRRLREVEFTKRPLLAELAGTEGLPRLLEGERINGITFDEVKVRPRGDLEKLLKDQREKDVRTAKLKQRAVLAEEQRDALQHQLERALSGPQMPTWCATMRSEAALQGETLNEIFDQLREVFFECVLEAREPSNAEARVRLQQSAAGTLYRTVASNAARAAAFAAEIKGHFGAEITLGNSPDEILSAAELDTLEARRREAIDPARSAFEQRKLDRLNDAKTGRGRKLKKLPKKPGKRGRPHAVR